MKTPLLLLLLALLFLSATTKAQSSFDVVVYGGTPGGVVSAVAASRSGAASVLLIEQTKHVGGLSTSGINTAELEHMLRWTFGGISLEFYERMGKKYGLNEPVFYFEPHIAEAVFNEMLAEAKVQTRFQLRVDKVAKQGAHIQNLTLSDGSMVRGKVFIDASYEGDLMARAGVKYTWGRESKAEYNEEAAGIRLDTQRRQAATMDAQGNLLPGISARVADLTPGAGDRKTMNYNFRLSLSNKPGNMVPIPTPTAYDRNRYKLLEGFITGKTSKGEKVVLRDILDLYQRRNDRMEVNNKQAAIISIGHFGGQFDYPDADYARREAITEDHKQYTLGLLYFLAHDATVPESLRQEMQSWGLNKSDFADNGHWPYYLYIREARRMRGRYVVTQHDLTTSRRKDDSIGMSSHFIDSHHVQRVAVSPTEFVNEGRIWRAGYAWQIPYRALTPKAEECDNLLVPVAASLTHVAFCAYRLESVWMIGGHAAGTAAALAIRQKKTVQSVNVRALQHLLSQQRQVLDFVKGQPEKFAGKFSPPEF
jgi:FAD dependent oxidoreductase